MLGFQAIHGWYFAFIFNCTPLGQTSDSLTCKEFTLRLKQVSEYLNWNQRHFGNLLNRLMAILWPFQLRLNHIVSQ